jgi:hypothetical protein
LAAAKIDQALATSCSSSRFAWALAFSRSEVSPALEDSRVASDPARSACLVAQGVWSVAASDARLAAKLVARFVLCVLSRSAVPGFWPGTPTIISM